MDYTLEGNTLTVGDDSVELTAHTSVRELATWLQARGLDPKMAAAILTEMRGGEPADLPQFETPNPEEIAAHQDAVLEAVRKNRSGAELSDEESEALSGATSEEIVQIDAALSSLDLSNQAAALGWIMGVSTGITPEDLLADAETVYEIAVAQGLMPESLRIADEQAVGEETLKVMKQSAVVNLLKYQDTDAVLLFSLYVNENPQAQYVGEHRTDGYLTMDLLNWADKYLDGNTAAAATLAKVGEKYGFEPQVFIHAAADMYKNRRQDVERGRRGRGPTVENATEPPTISDMVPKPGVTDPRTRGVSPVRSNVAAANTARLLNDFGARLQEGKELYKSTLLAMVHANDPDLASKMFNNWNDLSLNDFMEAAPYLGDLDTLGELPGVVQSEVDWFRSHLTGEVTKYEYDQASQIEAARTLTQQWNLDFDDSELLALTQQWKNGQLDKIEQRRPWVDPTAPIMDVTTLEAGGDPSVSMREAIRGTPEYQFYFGNKPNYQTEEAYASRFNTQSQALFGDVLPDLARVGMQTGSPEQMAAAGLMAGGRTSTFKGRMARMGEVFRRMT